MKKTIYLKNEKHEWIKFEYEKISELNSELGKRGIIISENSCVDYSYIGEGSRVEGSTVEGSRVLGGSTVEGSRVEGSTVLGGSIVEGSITKYTAMFAHNLYKYSSFSYLNKKGVEIIQLGCFTRSRKEWESDFWNNPKEFPNDGSEKSQARLRAFKVHCFFLDSINTK